MGLLPVFFRFDSFSFCSLNHLQPYKSWVFWVWLRLSCDMMFWV